MENNDSEFNEKKMLESMVNAQEYLEKALEYDNKKLRKKIEVMSKVLDKFQENPRKRAYKKLAKKNGMPFEMFNVGLILTGNMFREALEFDDNELREFIELFVEQAKINRNFFSGESKN